VDIRDGKHLLFNCSNRQCRWKARARLPTIRKTLIYLDTSTVSHIARAQLRNETGSPWIDLYDALSRAAEEETISCPGSSIVESEADLSELSDVIKGIARDLCDPGLESQVQVQEAQVFRALARFLRSEPPLPLARPPLRDAFHEDPHGWHPLFQIHVDMGPLPEIVELNRKRKAGWRARAETFFARYEEQCYDFEAIRRMETDAFGKAMVVDSLRSIIWHLLRERHGMESDVARRKAEEFLLSEHVSATPFADTHGRLLAGLAMLCRGPTPRKPKAGDYTDVEHIATYAPYVDVFIADRFFADLCNQPHIAVGRAFGTDIRRLSEANIEEFIGFVGQLRAHAPQAPLARKISQAIVDGGYHQERAKALDEYCRRHGWTLPES